MYPVAGRSNPISLNISIHLFIFESSYLMPPFRSVNYHLLKECRLKSEALKKKPKTSRRGPRKTSEVIGAFRLCLKISGYPSQLKYKATKNGHNFLAIELGSEFTLTNAT